jgi:hypothetical protein
VFGFGDAHYYGSVSAKDLTSPIVSLKSSLDGKGYTITARNDRCYRFGDAKVRRIRH